MPPVSIMMAAPVTDASLMKIQYAHLGKFMTTDQEKASMESILAEIDRLEQLDSAPENEPIAGAYPAYWKDLLSYDPVKTAETITSRCLCFCRGEEDYQVPGRNLKPGKRLMAIKRTGRFTAIPVYRI